MHNPTFLGFICGNLSSHPLGLDLKVDRRESKQPPTISLPKRLFLSIIVDEKTQCIVSSSAFLPPPPLTMAPLLAYSSRNHPPSSRYPTFLPRYIVLLAFISLVVLLIFEVDNFVGSFVSNTKTIAGHNLEPTPWHVFPAKSFEESKYSIATKIIQCSYLTRGSDTGNVSQQTESGHEESNITCPDVFRSIYYDLEPWAKSKISVGHISEAQKFAAFRVVIIGGKLFVEFYYACVQSRAMFTIWSFLQLLRRYPGKVPDVDLMFDCMDKPTINRTEHASMPLPLFRYCTTPEFFDIPFPDWSFWGWSEIHIEPWNIQFREIEQGSQATSWIDKSPIAYWKGNPDVFSPVRTELLQCNDTMRWNAEILRQDWGEAAKGGFEESKLSKQCNHRYKIYAEGYAWSVSMKYILACGSVPLIITPQYQDFFSRGLIPKKNFFPIPPFDLCRNIKLAVDWGNAHPTEAESIGKAAQDYMKSLSMDRIYDYMYHLIKEYSKLQDFTPVPPSSSLEVCADSVLCFADENQREFLEKSASSRSSSSPCRLQH